VICTTTTDCEFGISERNERHHQTLTNSDEARVWVAIVWWLQRSRLSDRVQ
jgi:hypothetical protein